MGSIPPKMARKEKGTTEGAGERGDHGRKWSRYDRQKGMTHLLSHHKVLCFFTFILNEGLVLLAPALVLKGIQVVHSSLSGDYCVSTESLNQTDAKGKN